MARSETKAQKMIRLAAQDRAGAAILRARGVTDHANALDERAARREKSYGGAA